jgi:hypothetical protein
MSQVDWIKTIVGFATSTLGFLVALLINSLVERRRDKKAFQTMLKAIQAEAGSNKVILNESFLQYYRDGMVVREFFLGTVVESLASPLFIKHVKHVKPAQMELLGAYLRNIKLANCYREKAEHFWLEIKRKEARDWLESILLVWDENLKQCQDSIDQVLALGGN